MIPRSLEPSTLSTLQKLIEENFTGRDELCAAAESLDDRWREQICRQLADYLAANAIELQQLVEACGADPAGPLDTEAIARALLDLTKANRGDSGVLNAAANREHNLRRDYDQAIKHTTDGEVEAILRKQREQVEFGEQVLRCIHSPSAGDE